jgi:Flp pilus assembly protein TadD
MILRMKSRLRLAWWPLCMLSFSLLAAEPSVPTPAVRNSALDGPLFYQLLLGELNVRQGSPGAGFSLLLDAARKTRDPALFQRAVNVALQSRSGEAALQAAQSWKHEIPDAREPNRYILQILLAVNRVEDAGQALAVSIDELPEAEKREAIISIPRVFARVSDKALAAQVVEKALANSLKDTSLQATAWTTIGRMRRDAQQLSAAIEAALKAHASDPQAQGPLVLALSLLPTGAPEIKAMLDEAMKGQVSAELRLGYARSLVAQQAPADAVRQLQQLTQQHPTYAPGWLLLGLLQIEAGQAGPARMSLMQHVELAKDSQDAEQQAGLTEALMALSQLAQQQGQLDQATRWLNQLPRSADPVRLAIRRAELLDQQGRAEEARVVLSQVQPASPEQSKRKALALSRWLRERQQAQQALSTLQSALAQDADDQELLTEQSLVLEKLKRYQDMEAVLRQLMRLRPQDPHAYNALGYSLADRGIRLDEARSLIVRAVELAPEDPFIQDSLGWLEFRAGRLEEARRILQAAYKARPDAEIAAHLGEVLWALGRKSEAASIWREGLLLKADNETLTETMTRLGFKP